MESWECLSSPVLSVGSTHARMTQMGQLLRQEEEEEEAICPLKVSRMTKGPLGLQVHDSSTNMLSKHKFSL